MMDLICKDSWMLSWKNQCLLILTCNQSECELLFYLMPGAAAGDELLFKHWLSGDYMVIGWKTVCLRHLSI